MEPKGPSKSMPNSEFKSAIDDLKEIQKDIPRGNLGKSLGKIEKGEIDTENPKEIPIESLKVQINGHVAFSLQEIWNGVKRDSPGGSLPPFDRSLEVFGVELESKIKDLPKDKTQTSYVLEFLKARTQQKLNQQVLDWYKFNRSRMSSIDPSDQDRSDANFKRYEFLLEERERYLPYGIVLGTVPSQLEAGVETAMDSMWGVLKIIPRIYSKQFHKQITGEELKKIARNSLPLIFKIAGLELGVFAKFRSNSRDAELEDFRLIDANGELKLDVVSSLTEGISAEDLTNPLRTGCPALVAHGSDGKSMMFELYDWIDKVADKFYFPLFTGE